MLIGGRGRLLLDVADEDDEERYDVVDLPAGRGHSGTSLSPRRSWRVWEPPA